MTNIPYHTCPNCGQIVMKGAMRCVKCGRILKTPEEQKAAIEKLMASKNVFPYGRVLKSLIVLVVVGIIVYLFSDQIIALIGPLFGR